MHHSCPHLSAEGLDFDVGIGGSGALFKSAVLGLLAQVCVWGGGCWRGARLLVHLGQRRPAHPSPRPPATLQYDWRVGALVRLVKLWARRHDINDSANGSLNSFALTLLVSVLGARAAV